MAEYQVDVSPFLLLLITVLLAMVGFLLANILRRIERKIDCMITNETCEERRNGVLEKVMINKDAVACLRKKVWEFMGVKNAEEKVL